MQCIFPVPDKTVGEHEGNRRLSLTRALKRCRCAGMSHTSKNEQVFPSQVHSASHSAWWWPEVRGVHLTSRRPAWLCMEARLFSSCSLCSPSSCLDVSSSLLSFLPASAPISLFCCLLGIMHKSRKKMFPSLSLCRRNMGLRGFFCCCVFFRFSSKGGRH